MFLLRLLKYNLNEIDVIIKAWEYFVLAFIVCALVFIVSAE